MKIDIVVAKYTENIEWLRKLLATDYVYRVFLYDKGPQKTIPNDIKSHPKLHYEVLVNSMRESGTYIHHILKHWGNFAERVVFTQGDPFDQAPQFMDFMPLYEKWDPVYQQISYAWFLDRGVPPRKVVTEKGGWFHEGMRVFEQEYYLDSLLPVDFDDPGMVVTQKRLGVFFDMKKGTIQGITEKYGIPIARKNENVGVFNYGAIFAVSRESIERKGIEVYRRILGFHGDCQGAPYAMERLWMMFFRAGAGAGIGNRERFVVRAKIL